MTLHEDASLIFIEVNEKAKRRPHIPKIPPKSMHHLAPPHVTDYLAPSTDITVTEASHPGEGPRGRPLRSSTRGPRLETSHN